MALLMIFAHDVMFTKVLWGGHRKEPMAGSRVVTRVIVVLNCCIANHNLPWEDFQEFKRISRTNRTSVV